MTEGPDAATHKGVEAAILIAVVVTLGGVVAVAFMAISFLGLFIWAPLGLLLPGLALFGCILRLRRSERLPARIGWSLASVIVLGWGLFLGVLVLEMLHHDQLMDEVAAFICSESPPPGDAVVRSCDGRGPENPSNGNTCGYYVDVLLETALAVEPVQSHYGGLSLPADLAELDMSGSRRAEREDSGLTRVEILVLGEPGADPRCN